MSKVIKIKKGKDINLVGVASKKTTPSSNSATYALKPTDFRNLIPKLDVKQGDEVKAGDVLFHDKSNEAIKFTSPVSGEVAEIVRGARRAILEVRVLADSNNSFKTFDVPASLSREAVKSALLESGLWPGIVQRPYGIIADPEVTPKAIHISCFDSAPLAPDLAYTLANDGESFKKGVEALKQLTDGTVHINVKNNADNNALFTQVDGVQVNTFSGPHPAGLVGIQIHHVDPINKGDVVWTIQPQHVVFIGRLLNTGKLDLSETIALAGSDVNDPQYIETRAGASIESIVGDQIKSDNSRIISGNVLTGTQVEPTGYLGFFDNMITAIPEGNEYEFMGWLLPTYARPTNSNSLPISKFLKKKFVANTNMHGEERAFVVTGEYEKVLPMDIYPVHLLKSILAQDLEAMENLGIFEVIEEDLALCEFVCTSKIEVQQILSDGLSLMEEEG